MTTTAVATPAPAGADPAADAAQHRQILRVITGLLAGLFTAMLSTTIVSTALPTIMSDLHGTQRQYTWVITASLLAMTISTPIWGKLSDLFNKKVLVQLAIVLFVAGSVGAGLSQTVPPMMAFRALQGLAMGGLVALTQSIMGALIPPRQRGRYSGYMGAVMAVSTVSGPLLGGVITDNASWRWCFFVCVPLAVMALILLQLTLRLPYSPRKVKIDYAGAALIAVVAALPMLWVTFAGSEYAWVSWQSAAFLAAFLVATAVAVTTELRVPEPMVPIRLLKNRTTILMIIASLGVGVAMFGSSTFLTQYFQLAGGETATRAGLMTIPLIVAQMLTSTIGGQVVTRTGRWKPLMVVGSIALVLGLVGLSTVDHTTPYWQVALSMSALGIGVGALIQNIVLAVQNTVDVANVGATSATISFFRSLGGAVGVSVLGAVLASHVTDRIATGLASAGASGSGSSTGTLDIKDLPAPVQAVVHAAYGDSFGLLFGIAAVISLVTLVSVLLVHEVPLRNTVALEKVGDEVPAQVVTLDAASAALEPDLDPEFDAEFDESALDDPNERLSVAALDVLTAAKDQTRQPQPASADSESLRSYEYALLLDSQQTAERVIRLARLHAERILTEADEELAERQRRIEVLRRAEAELSARVAELVRQD